MITFAESHVDLSKNITFTPQQLQRRWDQELLKKWRKEVQDNLRDFMQIKPALDPETFPNYAENDALLSEFITDKQTLYSRRVADETKNALLIATLAYEQAVRDVAALTLQINGREAVAEVPEVIDPETLLVTQEYVPAVAAVEALAVTIEQDGETVDNPAYLDAVAALAEAEAVIAGAGVEVVELTAERSV